jgi:hypothetical protein
LWHKRDKVIDRYLVFSTPTSCCWVNSNQACAPLKLGLSLQWSWSIECAHYIFSCNWQVVSQKGITHFKVHSNCINEIWCIRSRVVLGSCRKTWVLCYLPVAIIFFTNVILCIITTWTSSHFKNENTNGTQFPTANNVRQSLLLVEYITCCWWIALSGPIKLLNPSSLWILKYAKLSKYAPNLWTEICSHLMLIS